MNVPHAFQSVRVAVAQKGATVFAYILGYGGSHEIIWTLTYLLTMPKKEEKGQVYCLVNCCVCCAKNVVHAFATLVEKSVTASTVLL